MTSGQWEIGLLMNEKLKTGLELFNQKKYHEAHDVLEELWKGTASNDKYRNLYQGIIKASVSIHLFNEERIPGSKKLLDKALILLTQYEPEALSIDIKSFISGLKDFYLNKGTTPIQIKHF